MRCESCRMRHNCNGDLETKRETHVSSAHRTAQQRCFSLTSAVISSAVISSSIIFPSAASLLAGMEQQSSSHITSSRKLRVLCLHGFRTSGSIFQQQLQKLGSPILDLLDMSYTEFFGLDDSLSFLYKIFDEQGPFDGPMGFSQGSVLCAALVAMQQQGLALNRHPPLQFVVLIAGGTLDNPELKKQIYPTMITCPSVHIIGKNDERSYRNEDRAKMFEIPIVIRHEGKHIVPR